MGKNLVPILAFFLIALVAFLAMQVIGIITDQPLPKATQKQIQKIDPNLKTSIFKDLQQAAQN